MNVRAAAQRGFTLVEMAIVLVVIGLIIGAVSIGKDVMRNAEYHKISNKFVTEWKKSYDVAYQRTGGALGDNQQAPTGMVNGNQATIGGSESGGNASGLAGVPANYANTGLRLCNGQGYAAGASGAGDTQRSNQNLREVMQKIGVRMPPGRSEGSEDRYQYTDTNGAIAELQVCFQWNPPGTTSGAGNVMVVRGLTPDLARYIDQLIDGKPDAIEGRFRQQTTTANTATTNNVAGTQWAGNNTFDSSQTATATPVGTGTNLDENQIVLVTAHWTMDQ